MAAHKKPKNQLKSKPKTFRLSQVTVKKIDKAVRSKKANDQTDAIEKAVDVWDV